MNKAFDKIYNQASKQGFEKFKKMSDYMVEHYISPPSLGNVLSKEALDTISTCSAVDMAIGAKLVKRKYIITGVCIGVLASVIIYSQVIKKEDLTTNE